MGLTQLLTVLYMAVGKTRDKRELQWRRITGVGREVWVIYVVSNTLRVLEGVLWPPNIFPSSWEELPLKGNLDKMLVHL